MADIVTRKGILDGGDSVGTNINATEVSILERNNPHSVAYLLSETMREKLDAIDPRYFGCSEKDLRRVAKPNDLDEMLRLAFWDEYTVAVDGNRKMIMARVYGRICSKEMFFIEVVNKPLRLAYILRPPVEYMFKMRDLLELGHRRMREILELDIMDSRGNPNTKLITEMVKIVALVENRVRGAVVQKVQMEQKNLNINVDAPKGYYEVNDELKKLEKEIKALEIGDGGSIAEAEGREIKDAEEKEVNASSGEGGDEGSSSPSKFGEILQVAAGVSGVEE